MILHLGLPEQCTRGRIHRVGVGAHIPKKHRKLVGIGNGGKTDCGSNQRFGFKHPAGASAFCVERVDLAIAAPHKYQTSDNCWLGQCARHAKEPERPFQLQQGHLVLRQSGHRGWLKPAVAKIRTPSIPARAIEALGKVDRIVCALSGPVSRTGSGFRGFRSYEGCNSRPFGVRKLLCDGCHAPRAERSYDLLKRHRPEHG